MYFLCIVWVTYPTKCWLLPYGQIAVKLNTSQLLLTQKKIIEDDSSDAKVALSMKATIIWVLWKANELFIGISMDRLYRMEFISAVSLFISCLSLFN